MDKNYVKKYMVQSKNVEKQLWNKANDRRQMALKRF